MGEIVHVPTVKIIRKFSSTEADMKSTERTPKLGTRTCLHPCFLLPAG